MQGNEIGQRLKALRIADGLTQEDVAAAIHTSRANYTKMESGERDLKTEHCIALARFFDVSCDYILTGVEAQHLDIHEELGLSDDLISCLRLENEKNKRISLPIPQIERCTLVDILNELCSSQDTVCVLRAMCKYLRGESSAEIARTLQDVGRSATPDTIDEIAVGLVTAMLKECRGKKVVHYGQKDNP